MVAGTIYRCGRLQIDLGRRLLRADNEEVPLGARAFEIIGLLLQRGELVTKTRIIDTIWPGTVIGDNTLQVHISAIRKALGPNREQLQTVSGHGYRLLGNWQVDLGGSQPAAQDVMVQGPAARHQDAPVVLGRTAAGNLPLPATDLIGRTVPIQDLHRLVAAYQVVTLTGPGGIGKSGLALHVAHQLLPRFPSGGWMVELAAVTDPHLIPSAVAGALGLLPTAGSASPLSVAREIGSRKLLLVIDNCEQVVDAVALLVEAAVQHCPLVSILVTSRESLRIEGEAIYRVPPLNLPPVEQHAPDDLRRHSAIQLFLARTGSLYEKTGPPPGELAAIADICRRLDGIPLAIELAATRAATFGVAGTRSSLDNRFALLTCGRRTASPRHQTLRAALDWSYDLLSAPEQRLLACTAVFAGGFTLDAAGFVAGTEDDSLPAEVEHAASLVEKSLIVPDTSDYPARWRLLETTRAYAIEKCTALGLDNQVARRHARLVRTLLAANAPDASTQSNIQRTSAPARDIDNVRAALNWSFSSRGDIAIGVAIAAGAAPLFMAMSLLTECHGWTARAIAVLDEATRGTACEMALQGALGLSMMFTQGNSETARAALERGIELAKALAYPGYQLRLLGELHIFLTRMGAFRLSLVVAECSLELAMQTGDQGWVAMADCLLGCSWHLIGNQPRAERHLASGLAPLDLHQGIAIGYFGYNHRNRAACARSKLLWITGHPDQAVAAARRAVEEAEGLDHPVVLCIALIMTVSVFIWSGALDEAEAIIRRLQIVAERHSLIPYRSVGLGYSGEILVQRQELERGMSLLRDCLEPQPPEEYQIHNTGFTSGLAEAMAMVGQSDAALAMILHAICLVEHQEDSLMMPELLRINGDIIAAASPSQGAQARECLQESISWARRQAALSWELRAALSLAQLHRRQGELIQARDVLAPVYSRFTEGFATADLRAARSLLDQLPECQGSAVPS